MLYAREIGLYFFLIAFICSFSSIFPQRHTIRTYTIEDGLPTNVTIDVTQDKAGRMWFATEIGVSVYDGSKWKNFGESDGIAHGYYSKIKVDAHGTIWAMPQFARFSIRYYKNSKWFKIPNIESKRKDELFNAIDVKIENEKPVILVGTDKSIYLYKNDKWYDLGNKYNQLLGNSNSILQVDNKFYVTNSNGIFIIDGDKFDESINSIVRPPSKLILATGFDSSNGVNKIWLLGRDWIGYYDTDIKKFVLFVSNFYLKQFPTFVRNFIVPDNINKIWFGNIRENFSLEISSKNIVPLGMRNGFTNDGCTSIFVDKEKNIWFTSPRGVDKLTNTLFTNYDSKDGLGENEVSSIEEVGPGEYFFGHNYGFTLLKKNKFYYYNHSNLVPLDYSSGRVMDVCKDKFGNIYFAATFAGLGKLSNDGKVTWLSDSKNGKIGFSALQFDPDGNLWVGSLNGLYKYINGELRAVTQIGSRFEMIRQIYFSKNGKQFITASGGIYTFQDNKIVLAIDQKSRGSYFSIHDYEDGAFLVGKNTGVYLMKNKQITKFYFGSITIDQKIFFIEHDRRGNYWFGTDDGIYLWDGKNVRKFSMENGLSGRETNRFAWLNDSKDRVWIGTDRGVSLYQSEYDFPESIPVIQNVFLTDSKEHTYPLNYDVEFSFSNNTFGIDANAISFRDEREINYRMKLSGFDNEWLSLGKSHSSRYTNLNAGEYRLYVQAKNANGAWSTPFVSGMIIIKPPFYVTWWFACSIAVILFVTLRFVYTYNSQKKYSTQLEEEVALRTEALRSSEQKMKTLIENSPTLITTFNRDGVIQFINKDLDRVKKEQIVGHNLFEFFPQELHEDLRISMDIIFNDNQIVFFPHLFNRYKTPLYLESYISPIISVDGVVREAVAISLDQTAKKKSEDEKKLIEEKQNAILKAIPIILYNDSTEERAPSSWISESVEAITGFTQDDHYSGKVNWRERIHPDDATFVLAEFEKIKENKQLTLEYRWLTADNKYKWFLDFISPIKTYEDGKVEFFGILLDIHDRKRAQYRLEMLNEYFLKFGTNPSDNINKIVQLCGQELNANAAFYNRLINDKLVSVGYWGTPPDFNPVDNAEGHICTDLINSNSQEIKFIPDLTQTKYVDSDPVVANFGMKTYLGFPVQFGDSTKGSLCVVFDKFELPSAEDYKFLNILGAAIVIEEERRSAMELLQESVKEKETLLREVYHRVKNNLQVISSLLYLQATSVKDDVLLALLQESQNRVRSMALVHESLYNSKNLNEVELKGYINNLINHLKESYQISNRTNFEVNIEDVALSIDKAIPCGLVINEIITNSFKYGHPEDTFKDLSVSVSVRKSESTIKLIIRDNGNGLPDTINFEGKNKTLGINLIQKLTKQLDGTLIYNTNGGAKFTIEFPL